MLRALRRRLDSWGRRGEVGAPGSTTARPRRVPADLLAKVRRIEISTRHLVDRGVAGTYHSVFKGRGMEFAEVRPYQPGDDVRTIDWNRTARMGVPFVKQYVEERDLTVFLAIDVSGSLGFGSRAILKRELAAEISALLAFAALANHDRVGAALISEKLELFLPPQRRRNQVLRLVHDVLDHPASGGTDLDRGLAAVLSNLRQRSVLFLISDFVGAPPVKALQRAAARHDVVVVELADPKDLAPPSTGPLVLRDAETGAVAFVDGRRAADEASRARGEREALRSTTRALGLDHLTLATDRPYMPELVAFFEARKRRLRR
jgi:uncharacterized protein (DUF58 family)